MRQSPGGYRAASRAGADQKRRLSAHGAELTSTQPTGPGPVVTPPAIRGTRDAPLPPLAELAHAYPPFWRGIRVIAARGKGVPIWRFCVNPRIEERAQMLCPFTG